MGFAGYVELEASFNGVFLTKLDGALEDADALPTYRIYGPSGIMNSGTGTMAFLQTGAITDVENTTPIRVNTTASHGLQTNQRVSFSGITGAVAATLNGNSFLATVVDPDTISLQSTSASGTGTGGEWHLTGQYSMTHAAAAANGYEINETYTVIYACLIDSDSGAGEDKFTVV